MALRNPRRALPGRRTWAEPRTMSASHGDAVASRYTWGPRRGVTTLFARHCAPRALACCAGPLLR